jgi:hypothetical protein
MRSLRCARRRVVHSQTPSDAPSILSSAWNCARALAGPAWVFPRAAVVAVIVRLARRATLVADDDRRAVALQAVAGDAAHARAGGVPARRASRVPACVNPAAAARRLSKMILAHSQLDLAGSTFRQQPSSSKHNCVRGISPTAPLTCDSVTSSIRSSARNAPPPSP